MNESNMIDFAVLFMFYAVSNKHLLCFILHYYGLLKISHFWLHSTSDCTLLIFLTLSTLPISNSAMDFTSNTQPISNRLHERPHSFFQIVSTGLKAALEPSRHTNTISKHKSGPNSVFFQ